jgi:lactate permease
LRYLLWCSPILVVTCLILSRRMSSATAGLCGLAVAILAALVSAEGDFGPSQAALAVAQGIWLAALVASVILAGLVFRELVSVTVAEAIPISSELRRSELYSACFLFGPFAEAATGFGVGQVTIAPTLKRLELGPIDAVLFGLFSQIMVPWGALANGTIVGAQLSGLSPAELGTYSACLSAVLSPAWLCLFWHFASHAGVHGSRRDMLSEFCTTIAVAGVLVVANFELGPEPAGMIALAPLIAVHFLSRRSDLKRLREAIRVTLPYVALICGIAAVRAIAPINQFLVHALAVRPFAEGPAWYPLLHPATWLLGVGIVTALLTGRGSSIVVAFNRSWTLGKMSVLTIMLFLAMAQVMQNSGMARGCAQAIQLALGASGAALVTPLFAGLFGFLTSSSSTANGLLMPSQAALAQWGHLSLPWLAALQNVTAAALTMLSPVRVAVGCSLVGRVGLERQLYLRAWPLGAVPLIVLTGIATFVVLNRP